MDIELSQDAPTATTLAQANATIKALWSLLQWLSNRIDKLSDENKGLKSKLTKLSEKSKTNIKNSSLCPSKEKDSKNKSNVRRNALRKKTGKKRGAQPGHKRHERALLPPEEVDILFLAMGGRIVAVVEKRS